jgi:hypothetical protein
MQNAPGVLPTSYAEALSATSERLRERHIAERFARAMELLGDEKPEVRWGGIFALERLARRSPQDQSAVTEVLATYVRRRAAWKPATQAAADAKFAHIEPEIQLIVTILARRKWNFKSEERPLNLNGTNLGKAHLPSAHLESAFLTNCNLESALLFRANLQGAWLARSILKNVNLDGANLENADLSEAIGLTPEQLRHARLNEKTTLPPHLPRPLIRAR